ncbi:hypothetical protein HDU98_000441 [Podochytrium sp. JEL0797]|nr:hypothetical protein HDU98_000441 [Podochytrium sp. JEL0797]
MGNQSQQLSGSLLDQSDAAAGKLCAYKGTAGYGVVEAPAILLTAILIFLTYFDSRPASSGIKANNKTSSSFDTSLRIRINWEAKRIKGKIPQRRPLMPVELGKLVLLTELLFNNNELEDPLLDSFVALTALDTLDVSNNRFSGAIPVFWRDSSVLSRCMSRVCEFIH